MRITERLLNKHGACIDQVSLFAELWPNGMDPSPEEFAVAVSAGLDVLWCIKLLPDEGPGSKRAFALWCAEQVAYLMPAACAEPMAVVRRMVERPGSVTGRELATARATVRATAWAAWATAWAAWATARATAWAAAWDVGAAARDARDAAWATARDAAWAAAWAAAWDVGAAARDARDAAGDAARDAQVAMLAVMVGSRND